MGCLQAKERAPQQIQSRPGQVVPLEVLSVVPLPLGQQPQGARQQPVPQHVEGGLGGASPCGGSYHMLCYLPARGGAMGDDGGTKAMLCFTSARVYFLA